jgi:hypothetical protein
VIPRLAWPAERFFWAVLDAPTLGGCRALPAELAELLQDELPVPVDQVHVVAESAPGGKLVVCAAAREDLGSIGAMELIPEEVPSVMEPKVHTAALNLLVGDFEPVTLRRERSRRWAAIALTFASIACIAAVSLCRRADSWTKEASQARAAVSGLATNPMALHLELDRLRKVPRPDIKAAPDAAQALAALLSNWPGELQCQTESVSIGPASMNVSLTVAKDVRPFLSALRAPEGWTLDEPRLTATIDGARLSLVLHRRERRS